MFGKVLPLIDYAVMTGTVVVLYILGGIVSLSVALLVYSFFVYSFFIA